MRNSHSVPDKHKPFLAKNGHLSERKTPDMSLRSSAATRQSQVSQQSRYHLRLNHLETRVADDRTAGNAGWVEILAQSFLFGLLGQGGYYVGL